MVTTPRFDDLIAEARKYAGPDNGGWKPFDQNERIRHWPTGWSADRPGERAEFYADVDAWEAAHGHDVRLSCYTESQCQAIESYLEWLIARLADALEAAEAERDAAVKELRDRELHHFEVEQELAAALAVIERAREYAQGCIDQPGYGDFYMGVESAGEAMLDVLSSAPADAAWPGVVNNWPLRGDEE